MQQALKRINDTQGHAAGDLVLEETIQEWRLQLPESKIGRLGGDEFAIVLQGTYLNEARSLLMRLHAGAAHSWSGGVAELRRGETVEQWIHRADTDLYRAKAMMERAHGA